jgi:hypothetical protein
VELVILDLSRSFPAVSASLMNMGPRNDSRVHRTFAVHEQYTQRVLVATNSDLKLAKSVASSSASNYGRLRQVTEHTVQQLLEPFAKPILVAAIGPAALDVHANGFVTG